MTPSLGTRRAAATGASRSAAAARSAPVVRRRPKTQALRPARRVSGVSKTTPPKRASRRPAPAAGLRPLPVLGTIGSHALRAGKSIQGASLLDRLVRGRGWIGLLAALLIGLVFLNVSLLKLNAQAGRNAERARQLRIENAELNGLVTRLSSAERIERAAAKQGLIVPAPGVINYLTARGAYDAKLAAGRLDTGQFSNQATPVPASLTAPQDVQTQDAVSDPSATQPQPGSETVAAQPVPAPAQAPADQQQSTGGGAVPPAATTPGAG